MDAAVLSPQYLGEPVLETPRQPEADELSGHFFHVPAHINRYRRHLRFRRLYDQFRQRQNQPDDDVMYDAGVHKPLERIYSG